MKLYIYLLLILSPLLGYAQTHSLSGSVLEEKSKVPLEAASISLTKDSLGREMLGFAYSDAKGKFTINLKSPPTQGLWVHARHLGHKSQRVKLLRPTEPLLLLLRQEEQKLGELVVKARRREMSVRGDTISYNSASYRLGNERNLGEVIKRMPGMQLDAEGNVSYQGKKVDKLLINGEDLSLSSGVAMNSLSADFASSVELYQNHNEDTLTKDFSSKDKLALNILSAKKTAYSGKAELAGGIKNKFRYNSPSILQASKLSLLATLTGNNIGDPTISIGEYLKTRIGESDDIFGSQSSIVSLSKDEQELLYPPQNEYARDRHQLTLNSFWRPNENYSLRSNALYAYNKSKGERSGVYDYFTEQTPLTTYQQRYLRKQGKLGSLELQQKWTPTPSWLIKAYTSIGIRTAERDVSNDTRLSNASLLAWEDDSYRAITARQSLQLHRQALSVGLLSFSLVVRLETGRDESDIRLNTNLLPERLLLGRQEGRYLYGNTLRYRQGGLSAAMSLNYPLTPTLQGRLSLKAQLTEERERETMRYRALQRWGYSEHSLSAMLYKRRGTLRYQLGASLKAYHTERTPREGVTYLPKGYHIEPEARVGIHFGANHRLEGSVSYTSAPLSLQYLSTFETAESYNSYRLSSTIEQALSKKLKLSGHYLLSSVYHRFFLFLLGLYERTSNGAILASLSPSLLSQHYYSSAGANSVYTFKGVVNKGFAFSPIDLKAQISYMEYDSPSMHNRLPTRFEQRELSTRLSLLSRFKGFPLNFELSAQSNIRHNRYHDREVRHSKSREWTAELKGILSLKELQLTASAYHSQIDAGGSKHHINDIALQAMYRLGKRFELSLVGKDILHLGGNRWTSISLSQSMRSSEVYQRLPGYLLLQASYSF